jgi:co-chaperonin GroES (HSP10)
MLKAIAHRLIVKPDPIQEKTKGGIVLAVDEKLEKGARVRGTIVDIGEDVYAAFKCKTQYAGLKVGDKVYFARYAGKLIVDENTLEEFIVLIDEDVVVKEVPNDSVGLAT